MDLGLPLALGVRKSYVQPGKVNFAGRRRLIGRLKFFQHGSGVISGPVTIENVPVGAQPKRVRLYDRATGQLLDEVLTDADSVYTFTGVDTAREYTVESVDDKRRWNAVVQDMVRAGP